MNDAELDAFLAGSLREDELTDDGFASMVLGRLQQHRNRRRRILGFATAAACIPVIIGAWLSPVALFSEASLNAGTGVAVMLLAATCGAVWITTESIFNTSSAM